MEVRPSTSEGYAAGQVFRERWLSLTGTMSEPRHGAGTRIKLVRSSPNQEAHVNTGAPAATRPDGSPDWSALMARAQGGDRDAYRQLLQSITPWLRGLARRHGVHPDAVEDVVQDILATVHVVRH